VFRMKRRYIEKDVYRKGCILKRRYIRLDISKKKNKKSKIK